MHTLYFCIQIFHTNTQKLLNLTNFVGDMFCIKITKQLTTIWVKFFISNNIQHHTSLNKCNVHFVRHLKNLKYIKVIIYYSTQHISQMYRTSFFILTIWKICGYEKKHNILCKKYLFCLYSFILLCLVSHVQGNMTSYTYLIHVYIHYLKHFCHVHSKKSNPEKRYCMFFWSRSRVTRII